jgi:fibronectin-binding autotransporter adhesin
VICKFAAFILSLAALAAVQNVALACTGSGTSGSPYVCAGGGALSRNGNTGPVGSSSINTSSSISAGSKISSITITTNWNDPNGSNDWALDLAAPNGTNNLVFFGFQGCGNSTTEILTFSDAGSSSVPACSSGTFQPSVNTITNSDCPDGDAGLCYNPTFSAGSPSTLSYAGPYGSSTFNSSMGQFHGVDASGIFTLYGFVASGPDGNSGGITSWSISIVLETATPTSISVSATPNPVSTSGTDTATLTATLTASPSNPGIGTVEFLDNSVEITGCGAVTLGTSSPSGHAGASNAAVCLYTPSPEGTHIITFSYTDSSNTFDSVSGTAGLQADNPTTNPNSGQYCNTGTISDNGAVSGSPANQYPSEIVVPSLTGSLSSLSLTLQGVTSTDLGGIDVLLVSPAGVGQKAFVAMNAIDDVNGDTSISASGTAFTLTDTGSGFPSSGALSNNGAYKPFASTLNVGLFPGPASQTLSGPPSVSASNAPENVGTATFGSIFDGVSPSGTWQLFVVGSGFGTSMSATGWCVNLTTSGGAVTTTGVTSFDNTTDTSSNPMFTGNSITFTAMVASGGNPVTSGTVTFEVDGVTVQGPTSLSGSGTVTYSTSSLAEGIHTIQAFYNGTGSFNVSNGSLSQEVDHPTVVSNNNLTFCNPGGISISGTKGADTPYPSRVFVSNVPGTIKTVSVNLDNFSIAQQPELLDMLLVGPQSSTSDLVFWSHIGGPSSGCSGSENPFSDFNFTFEDSASGAAPACGALSSGATYQPSAYPAESFSFPSPAPSSLTYSATIGSGTFTSQFANLAANGTWELFGIQDENVTTNTGSIGQWCMNLTVNPPVFAIASSHSGSFTQGDTADTYTITVTNNGPGATAGTLTLADTLPTGITAVSMSETGNTGGGTGSDWSCTGTTCTRTTTMNSGESDTITLTVGVSYSTATGTNAVTNSVSVSGGGISATQTASDPTTIIQGPGYALTTGVSPSGSGTVSPNPTNSTGFSPGSYLPGAVVTLTASPSAGYAFSSWGGSSDLSSTSANPTTITMNSATESVTATFVSSPATVTSVSSTTANGSYTTGAAITVTVTFNKAVTVTGTPQLALNSGGTAGYTSGSGTSTLAFLYTVAAGQNSARLDATSSAALTLNSGTILTGTTAATLTLPTPGGAGSLGANTNIVINTTAPTVVSYNVLWGSVPESYNVIGSTRGDLPWQITGIKVVFSEAIASGNVNSLSGTGVTTTGFSGLGTNTLTWTISPLTLGNYSTTLAGGGANALKDAAGNALTGGTGFSQGLSVLYGDFNGDLVVNSQDTAGVEAAIGGTYNIFADINGDGAVTSADYTIVRSRLNTSLP